MDICTKINGQWAVSSWEQRQKNESIHDMPLHVAVVTGANKGIGLEIAIKLASAGMRTILACRDEARGHAATDSLKARGLNVEFRQLDIGSDSSIKHFVTKLSEDFDHVDVLVNNAAIGYRRTDPVPFFDQVESTFAINFFGTVAFTKEMLPLLKRSSHPRIVNVASMAGHLKIQENEAKHATFSSPTLTEEELMSQVHSFVEAARDGTIVEHGWPNWSYGMSKLCLIAYTKVLAREEPGILINCCCPGYCATDLTKHLGPRSAEEGARTPAFLVLTSDEFSGKFYHDEVEIEW